MHYAYPQLSGLGLLLVAALAGLVALAWWRRRRALGRLAESPSVAPLLLVSRPRQTLKAALLLAAGGLLAFAVLGPQWGEVIDESPEPPASGRDVLFLLDVSRSMLAEDVAPSRLARAKADIRDLAAALEKRGGHRVGLVAFADRAATLCPLTSDFRCFEEELTRVSRESLRLRGEGADEGTQIGSALVRVSYAVDPEAAAHTDVLLFSDGGDMISDTLTAADELSRRGVAVHTFGLGDPARASTVPIARPDGSRTYLQHKGEVVRVKLEEEVLRQVAKRTGGQYVAVGTGFVELDRWYDGLAGAGTTRALTAGGRSPLYVHRFQWFLAPAVALLLLPLLFGHARPARPQAARKERYFVWLRLRRRRFAAAPPDTATEVRS